MFGRMKVLGTIIEYGYFNEIVISEGTNLGEYHVEMSSTDDRHRYYERRNSYPEYSYHYHNLKIEFYVKENKICKTVEDVWTDRQLVAGQKISCVYDTRKNCIKKLII